MTSKSLSPIRNISNISTPRTAAAVGVALLALAGCGGDDVGMDTFTPTPATNGGADGGTTGISTTGTTAITSGTGGDVTGISTGVAPPTTGLSTTGSTADGGTPGLGEDGGTMPSGPANPGLCHLKGSQVVVLGDSYIALDPSYILLDTQPFTRNLEDLSRSAGALGPDESYRSHALSGASMAAAPAIPPQLDDAINNDPDIKLVILDGGGNDILVNNRLCLEYATEAELVQDEACVASIDDALAAGQELFDRGIEAGVGAAIYFFYPHLPGLTGGGIGAGTYPNIILDYAYPRVRALCERQTGAPCYFVDMRPVFDLDGDGESDPGMINIDGIHPTAESSKLMAEAVWEVMQQQCLGSE